VSSYIASDGNPFEFFRLIFQTIRISLINQGITIDPILHDAGIKVGEVLYSRVRDPEIKQFMGNIAQFWETHSLGRVEVKSLEPLIINVYDCFECRGLPYLGRPACAFDSGILKALFSAYYQEARKVTETRCYAMGDNYCSFTIE
jgi:predicted hydrocarbon binding protein